MSTGNHNGAAFGVGAPGEVRVAPNGTTYQWVQGIDGLGNPVGFWRSIRRGLRRVVRRAMPFAKQFAPFVPGGAAWLQTATPYLKRAGLAGYDGVGSLHAAPDGALYQVDGIDDDEMQGVGDDDPTALLGLGSPGEVRRGSDGQLYQWVHGVDGLGNPVGFWSALRRGIRGIAKRAIPFAQRFAKYVPGPYGMAIQQGLRTASPFLRYAGYAGMGALYDSPNGYDVQGAADDDMSGFGDEDLTGVGDELVGLEDDLDSLGQDDQVTTDGFVPDGVQGMGCYGGTPTGPSSSPHGELFRPLW
jgi:hypothetical protein